MFRRKAGYSCKLAEETLVSELKTIAKTIRDRLDGTISDWTFGHVSKASMEGFNNKIRQHIRLAYGFRDRGNTLNSKSTNTPKSTAKITMTFCQKTVEEAKKVSEQTSKYTDFYVDSILFFRFFFGF